MRLGEDHKSRSRWEEILQFSKRPAREEDAYVYSDDGMKAQIMASISTDFTKNSNI